MKISSVTLAVLLWFGSSSFARKRECSQVICYTDLGIVIHLYKGQLNKTIKIRLRDDTVIKARIVNCEGRSSVEVYKHKRLISKLNYSEGTVSDEILQMFNKREGGYVDYAMPNVTPKKNGNCTFYDKTGKIISMEEWANGVLEEKVNR